jgi:hypothetical protein
VATGFFVMGLRISWKAIDTETLETVLHDHLPEEWSRDGILEHQITTQEPIQLCFRRRATDDVPRATLCLSGTDDILTDAAVVPVDRGPDLSEAQRSALLSDFADRVLEPAFDGLEGCSWED